MFSRNGILIVVALVSLAVVCHAAMGSDTSDNDVSALAISINANGDETASIPDFDGDGTIGFGDFVIFAGVFGARQGDEKYEAKYDLNGDGEIGFADFLIFAENFGKELPSDYRAALVALYEATDGPSWTNKEKWLSAAPLGEWYGVTTDSQGRVIELNLRRNNLQGTLPAKLARLTNLEELNLYVNQLWGSIPTELARLSNLTLLTLGFNKLRGSIPTELARLSNLTELSLDNNQLTGAIPTELARLTKLTSLELQKNQLTGAIPTELARLTKLTWLDLSRNLLTGAIPTQLGRLTNLEGLHFERNQLTGAIPTELGQLTKLRYLYINFNQLTGGIPKELGQLTKLTSLWLNGNQLTGPIPKELTRLTNLEHLTLNNNQLTGGIPKELGQLTSLTYLRLNWNQLTGAIPPELGQLDNLTRLYLHGNQLTGTIPGELGQLINLTLLNLGLNPLSGTIPVELGQLINLTVLSLTENQLTGKIPNELGQLTNLTVLALGGNKFTDISSLGGLTNLNKLYLFSNDIIDISTLAGLTNLSKLQLADNNITDISPLANFTNLTHLSVAYNNFTDPDVSALAGLIHLVDLDLRFNGITDISALAGLTSLERLNLRGNPLSDVSIAAHVSALQNMGVTVVFDSFRKGDFDVELIFVGSFAEKHRNMMQYVARRWMAVIVEELPDYEFIQGWSGRCGDHTYEITAGERIDDLRIYMTTFGEDDHPTAVGWGGPSLLREETHLPVLGCVGFNLESANLLTTGLHEVGHVLGFGTVWRDLGLIQDLSRDDPNADTHFNGPLAIVAFDDAGGTGYTGAKVPVKKMDGAHWRGEVFERGELMLPWGGGQLSAVTVQSLADLGYGVDVSQADAFTLPGATAGKAAAKIAVVQPTVRGFDVNVLRSDAYTLLGVDIVRPVISPSRDAGLYGQGRIPDGPSSILGDGRWTVRLESAERFRGRGADFDLPDERQMLSIGPLDRAEPELTCGAGQINEPIYVVDSQGRIVRTIHR